MSARLLFNAIVHRYLIPSVQVGTKVTADEHGQISSLHTACRPVTGVCCVTDLSIWQSCKRKVRQRASGAQRYVDDEEVVSPSLIALNAVVASQAVTDFMFYMTSLTDPTANLDYLRFAPLTRETSYEEPRKSLDCRECGDLLGHAWHAATWGRGCGRTAGRTELHRSVALRTRALEDSEGCRIRARYQRARATGDGGVEAGARLIA